MNWYYKCLCSGMCGVLPFCGVVGTVVIYDIEYGIFEVKYTSFIYFVGVCSRCDVHVFGYLNYFHCDFYFVQSKI